jgi:hypothetical protein
MFDWYSIKFLYPFAFDKFTEVMFPNIGIESLSTLVFFDIKRLYSFFDKEGIYLIIEMYNKDNWNYCMSLSNGFAFSPSKKNSATRNEVEHDGFFECFRFLEKKLVDAV